MTDKVGLSMKKLTGVVGLWDMTVVCKERGAYVSYGRLCPRSESRETIELRTGTDLA